MFPIFSNPDSHSGWYENRGDVKVTINGDVSTISGMDGDPNNDNSATDTLFGPAAGSPGVSFNVHTLSGARTASGV